MLDRLDKIITKQLLDAESSTPFKNLPSMVSYTRTRNPRTPLIDTDLV